MTLRYAKEYDYVNAAWPAGTDEGRLLKPTPEQALSAAKILYHVALGKDWWGGWKIVSGRQYAYPINGVMRVNPDRHHGSDPNGAGWHGVVHLIAHYAARRLYGEVHGPRQAKIERRLVEYTVQYLI